MPNDLCPRVPETLAPPLFLRQHVVNNDSRKLSALSRRYHVYVLRRSVHDFSLDRLHVSTLSQLISGSDAQLSDYSNSATQSWNLHEFLGIS